ncbi:MAG: hypothetical protein F6K00_25765 [Leptolyngbya sp. SIOISBB]|nr:hypothetical protein [Leptolyngbya sp. SIOISBB]
MAFDRFLIAELSRLELDNLFGKLMKGLNWPAITLGGKTATPVPMSGIGQQKLWGIAQGWALRAYWPHYRLWALATIIGGYLVLVALLACVLLARWPVFVSVFVCGAIAAGPQAWVLHRHRQPWRCRPLMNAVILTLTLFWFLPDMLNASIYGNTRPVWEWVARAAIAGLIGSSLKGMALTQFLQPR